MKTGKILTVLLAFILAAALAVPAAAAGAGAVLSPQSLSVNGVLRDCEKYNIDGRYYCMHRDLAALLSGTADQFDVDYDSAKNAIVMNTGKAYEHATGGELQTGVNYADSAVVSRQKLIVNGRERSDLSIYNIGGRNFFQLRELGSIAGFLVDYDPKTNTAIVNSSDYVPPAAPPVTSERQSFTLESGKVNAWVVRVDTSDPRVTVKTAMVDSRLGATADFRDIVRGSGAYAAVNANFFESYQDFKSPIGHFMADGVFLHAVSGNSSLGIDSKGGLHMGREPVFTRIKSKDGKEWVAFEVNSVNGQAEGNTVLYTPAFGGSITMAADAKVMTVRGDVIDAYHSASAGEVMEIPSDGYLLWLSSSYMNEPWVKEPRTGAGVRAPEPYLFNPTADSFPLDGIVGMISGSPRLVSGGKACFDQDPGFDDPARFGPKASAPRTAVGIGSDGRLVLVSADSATIQQLRELMLSLGCVEAMNLDGGASRGMYENGNFRAVPGRQLTTTLQIFVGS